MKELALHILDVAENGIAAGADRLEITIEESRRANRMVIVIEDNGRGVPPDIMGRITDPFYTTRTTRRVGLGLSLFENTANQCDGALKIESEPGGGTRVTASMAYDHIDRPPLGDMASTLMTLIYGNPDVALVCRYRADDTEVVVDTEETRKKFDSRPITDQDVFRHIMKQMEQLKTKR